MHRPAVAGRRRPARRVEQPLQGFRRYRVVLELPDAPPPPHERVRNLEAQDAAPLKDITLLGANAVRGQGAVRTDTQAVTALDAVTVHPYRFREPVRAQPQQPPRAHGDTAPVASTELPVYVHASRGISHVCAPARSVRPASAAPTPGPTRRDSCWKRRPRDAVRPGLRSRTHWRGRARSTLRTAA